MASGDAVNRFLNPYQPPQSEWTRADQAAFRRLGVVSIWAGSFGSVDAAEWYFALAPGPERNRPPYDFIEDFDLLPFSLECLELNFTQDKPRPLRELLETASFSSSYIEAACRQAEPLGLAEAQGLALLFNYDYQACPQTIAKSEKLQFLGVFPYDDQAAAVRQERDPRPTLAEVAEQAGFAADAVAVLINAAQHLNDEGFEHFPARQLCETVRQCQGGDAFLVECGLRTSEDLGRLVYRLVEVGHWKTSPGDLPADFDGLYAL